MSAVKQIFLDDLIGRNESYASSACICRQFEYRVTNINGESQLCTQDFHTDRVNVHVRDGFVTKAYTG